METTAILKCTCDNPQQDAIYGKGLRLHNLSQGKKKDKAYCTGCDTRSNDKMSTMAGAKDVTPEDHKMFGVNFTSKKNKLRIGKPYKTT
jgi:hypothetical protein